jgi:hypothetical protein
MSDEVLEQPGIGVESPPAGAALDDKGSTQKVVDPARLSPERDTTVGKPTEGQPESVKQPDVDYKSKYEEERQARERAETGYREQQSAARSAESLLRKAEQERAQRVSGILSNQDLYDEIRADPAKWDAFNSELVAVRMAERDQSMRDQQRKSEWNDAREDLVQWFCAADDGPKMTLKEFNDWDQRHGRAFTSYGDPREGIEQAKVHIRGLHFDKFADRVRSKADENAHKKAMTTIKDANPPGSTATSLGKEGKTPQEREYDMLGSLPRGNAARDFFKKGA